MAVRFTRVFRNIARCFPGAGASWQGPSLVSDGVLYTEGLFRPSICQDLVFRADAQSAATGGASTTLTHPEPAIGNIHIPIHWIVSYDGIANIQMIARLFRTTSNLENWGGWSTLTMDFATYRVGSVLAAQPERIPITAFPYMRGFQLQAVFPTPAAATNVISILWAVEMPMELATVDTWKALAQTFMWNRPLP